MSKKGRGKKPRRRNTGLSEHRRERKTLTPPFLQLDNLKHLSWQDDQLPDFLWLAAIEQETGNLPLAHRALDILDDLVPEESKLVLDGRLSRFALIPEELRTEARERLLKWAEWALPDGLVAGLALYPECPADWLAIGGSEDWDPLAAGEYLKRLVAPISDPKGSDSTRLRIFALARHAKGGKLFLPPDSEFVSLMPRYPDELDEDELEIAESLGRATWNAMSQMDDESGAVWSRYFWRQSWDVSPCQPWQSWSGYMKREVGAASETEADSGGDPSESGTDEEQGPSLAEIRDGFRAAVDRLGEYLRDARDRCRVDLYDPTADEVRLGLASRHFRLLRRFIEDPRLWTAEFGPYVARAMVEARIVTAWLLKKDDPGFYLAFKEYGMGKRKLFKLQLEQFIDRDDFEGYEGLEAIQRRLEAEVNVETMEEFQKIDLGGSFAGIDIRKMAIEADLKDLYVLNYQPYSTEAHGEWGSLANFDLEHCGNPLHAHHRRPSFVDSDPAMHPGWVRHLFSLAWESIDEVFAHYDVDVDSAFERCLEGLSEAMRLAENSTQD